jgi:hypothetical protein
MQSFDSNIYEAGSSCQAMKSKDERGTMNDE